MKITSSDIRFEFDRLFQREETVTEVGDGAVSSRNRTSPSSAVAGVSISQLAKNRYLSDRSFLLSAQQELSRSAEPDSTAADTHPVRMIQTMAQTILGRDVRVTETMARSQTNPAEKDGSPSPDVPASTGRGQFTAQFLEIRSLVENESLDLHSTGVIRTGDGLDIQFELQLRMDRTFRSQETLLRQTTAGRTTDPLIITLSGSPPEPGDRFFRFDLNGDGELESIANLGQGSGFLSLDRNGDGRINDGGELFGPQSGDGFLELAAFDQDGNRWIDENDPVYEQLSIWSRDEKGQDVLMGLKDAGIGAIHLEAVASPFVMTDDMNRVTGQLRRTGILVKENGEVRHIYQMDLAHQPEPTSPGNPAESREGSTGLQATLIPNPGAVKGLKPTQPFFLGFPSSASDVAGKSTRDDMIETLKKRFEKLMDDINQMQENTRKKVKNTADQAAKQYARIQVVPEWNRPPSHADLNHVRTSPAGGLHFSI